jgi:hypothetical protein
MVIILEMFPVCQHLAGFPDANGIKYLSLYSGFQMDESSNPDAPMARYSTRSGSDLVTRDIYQVATAPRTVPLVALK